MEKIAWDGPKWGREDLFPANPDLANILGRTDLDFESFYFLDPTFLDFQVPRSPNSQISRFTDFQTPPAPTDPDELSDPNLTPIPTHPKIKYVARSLLRYSNQDTVPASLLCQRSRGPPQKVCICLARDTSTLQEQTPEKALGKPQQQKS